MIDPPATIEVLPGCATPAPLLIDSKRAAATLGIGTRTLWTLTKAGEIPHVRIRRRVLYAVEDLRRWIDAQRRHGR